MKRFLHLFGIHHWGSTIDFGHNNYIRRCFICGKEHWNKDPDGLIK